MRAPYRDCRGPAGSGRARRDRHPDQRTNNEFSNTLLGVFQNYTEVDNYRSTRNRHLQAEWFMQDTWRPRDRLTLDYSLRFVWFTPYWQANQRTAAFVPER